MENIFCNNIEYIFDCKNMNTKQDQQQCSEAILLVRDRWVECFTRKVERWVQKIKSQCHHATPLQLEQFINEIPKMQKPLLKAIDNVEYLYMGFLNKTIQQKKHSQKRRSTSSTLQNKYRPFRNKSLATFFKYLHVQQREVFNQKFNMKQFNKQTKTSILKVPFRGKKKQFMSLESTAQNNFYKEIVKRPVYDYQNQKSEKDIVQKQINKKSLLKTNKQKQFVKNQIVKNVSDQMNISSVHSIPMLKEYSKIVKKQVNIAINQIEQIKNTQFIKEQKIQNENNQFQIIKLEKMQKQYEKFKLAAANIVLPITQKLKQIFQKLILNKNNVLTKIQIVFLSDSLKRMSKLLELTFDQNKKQKITFYINSCVYCIYTIALKKQPSETQISKNQIIKLAQLLQKQKKHCL